MYQASDPLVHQAWTHLNTRHRPEFPSFPFCRLQGLPQGWRGRHLEGLCTLQGLVAPAFLETVGWQAGVPLRVGVWAAAEVGQWNVLSTHTSTGRGILTMVGYSCLRGCPWRSAHVHGWELSLYGAVWGFCLLPGWGQILGVFAPSVVSATASYLQTPSGVTGTADPNGSPLLETPELRFASPVCLPSLKGPCCSEIQSHTCPLFPSWYKGGRHCAR